MVKKNRFIAVVETQCVSSVGSYFFFSKKGIIF